MYFDINLAKLIKGTYSYFSTLSDKRCAITCSLHVYTVATVFLDTDTGDYIGKIFSCEAVVNRHFCPLLTPSL